MDVFVPAQMEPPAAARQFNPQQDWADATQRQRPIPTATKQIILRTRDARLFGCARCLPTRITNRDAGNGITGWCGHRRSGGVAAALGQPGQGGTANSGKVLDSLQYLAEPFTEIGLGPDNAVVLPRLAAQINARADDEAVTVPVGDAAKHRGDGGDQRGRAATAMPASTACNFRRS